MKEKSWRDYVAQGAKCLKLESVRKIFRAKIAFPDGKSFNYKALRNKTVAAMMIMNHFGQKTRVDLFGEDC